MRVGSSSTTSTRTGRAVGSLESGSAHGARRRHGLIVRAGAVPSPCVPCAVPVSGPVPCQPVDGRATAQAQAWTRSSWRDPSASRSDHDRPTRRPDPAHPDRGHPRAAARGCRDARRRMPCTAPAHPRWAKAAHEGDGTASARPVPVAGMSAVSPAMPVAPVAADRGAAREAVLALAGQRWARARRRCPRRRPGARCRRRLRRHLGGHPRQGHRNDRRRHRPLRPGRRRRLRARTVVAAARRRAASCQRWPAADGGQLPGGDQPQDGGSHGPAARWRHRHGRSTGDSGTDANGTSST